MYATESCGLRKSPLRGEFYVANDTLAQSADDVLRAALVWLCATLLIGVLAPMSAHASELDLEIPELTTSYTLFGAQIAGSTCSCGLAVCVFGMLFGLAMYHQVKRMPVHKSMADVSHIIYETCKTYLLQQGRLLIVLEVFIGACIVYYFGVLQHLGAGHGGAHPAAGRWSASSARTRWRGSASA